MHSPPANCGKRRQVGLGSACFSTFRIAKVVCSTEKEVMQRKSTGHSRRKHGEQRADPRNNWCVVSPRPGPVSSSEVLPNKATTGVPRAAARCIGPLSFPSSNRQHFKSAINSRKVVFPARLITRLSVIAAKESPVTESERVPKLSQTQSGTRLETSLTTSANRSNGQHFAGPYAADTFNPSQARLAGLPPGTHSRSRARALSTSLAPIVSLGGKGEASAPSAAARRR